MKTFSLCFLAVLSVIRPSFAKTEEERDAEPEVAEIPLKGNVNRPPPHASWIAESSKVPPRATPGQAMVRIEERLQKLEEAFTSRKTTIRTTEWTWTELESFQKALWRAMALDPAQMDDAQIPPYIHPRALTQQLASELVRLERSRPVAVKYGVEAEFDDYLAFCRQLILWRDEGLFRQSRLVAKRGVLEEKYVRLSDRVAARAVRGIEVGLVWNDAEQSELLRALHDVKREFASVKADPKRQPASLLGGLESVAPLRSLLWMLAPLLFLTGFVGGLLWARR